MTNADLIASINRWIAHNERMRYRIEHSSKDKSRLAYYDGQITAYKDVLRMLT